MRRRVVAIAVATAAGVILAACRGDSDSSTHMGGHEQDAPVHAGARQITMDATPFSFSPSEITMRAGEEVTIVMHSQGAFHDFKVQGKGHVVGANAGKTGHGGLRSTSLGRTSFGALGPATARREWKEH